MFVRFSHIPKNEITIGRILRAITRRLRAMPHHLAWQMARLQNLHSVICLADLKDMHHGERCFILGNGPSLATMNLGPLKHEISFGLNRIYLNFDRMNFKTTYLVCMNELVLEQSASDIAKIEVKCFLNWNQRGLFPYKKDLYYLREVFRPHFSKDISKKLWGGATVTFAAMQVAYYMGFKEVILVGIDHSFKQVGIPHKTVVSKGRDENHFDPEYFPQGFRWQLPDLQTSEYAYRLAKETYESAGRRILDATIGGKLTVFPKVDFYDVVKPR